MNKDKIVAVEISAGRGVCFLWFDTSWGRCCLTYSPKPFTVFRITLPGREDHVCPDSADGSRAAHPSAIRVGQIITAFFNGQEPPAVPENWLSLDRLTPGERAVLGVVQRIPYGATHTYAEVSRLAGFPGGARFAGNALHKNPFPVIIPCHRVVRSDGTIGGFASGAEMKEKMLALEAETIKK